MVNKQLIDDYIKRAVIRKKSLEIFFQEKDYPDVIRESQEIIELIQKAILISIGIQPPKWHDAIDIILENEDKINKEAFLKIKELKKDSKWLRIQREISFYGDADFVPLKEYDENDAKKAFEIV